MVSSKKLKDFPNIRQLKSLSKSIAMLDAIIEPEWQFRYYSFDARWSDNEELASMRNGSGDDYFILFNNYGALVKGYAHESQFGRYFAEKKQPFPGILESIPQEFKNVLIEPAYVFKEVTFCCWRTYSDKSWNCGITDFSEQYYDGSGELLSVLNNKPETYKNWAEEYYEKEINLDCVQHIYQHKQLTQALISKLNYSLLIKDLTNDIQTIGYPEKITSSG